MKLKVLKNLEERGITLMFECKLIDIITSQHHDSKDPLLQKILLKRLDIPDEEEEEDEFEQDEMGEARSDNEANAGEDAKNNEGGLQS